MKILSATLLCSISLSLACRQNSRSQQVDEHTVKTNKVGLPTPDEKASKTKFSKVIGWGSAGKPTVPAGFTVTKFADGLKSPRNIVIAPNGDILVVLSNSERSTKEKIANAVTGKAKSEVAGKSANTIVLFRDTNGDGHPESSHVFLAGLSQPYGMAFIGDWFYVANTDGVWQYPYINGQTQLTGEGKKILDLPAGGYNNHWTRNLLVSEDGKKIYVSVGSGSNVAEHGMDNEKRRANILQINTDGTSEKIFASGLRNPVGMALNPVNGELWTAVNERDELGDNLVPDYITSVKEGVFYGWPYSYFGPHPDPRLRGAAPDLVAKAVVPDVALGAHTASLGLAFYTAKKFPARYHNGAFVGQHGSWNRSELSGYKVLFVPFKDGKPTGTQEDFLTGFIANEDKAEVHGRPVGVAVAKDGSLLVADDVSGVIWRVIAK